VHWKKRLEWPDITVIAYSSPFIKIYHCCAVEKEAADWPDILIA